MAVGPGLDPADGDRGSGGRQGVTPSAELPWGRPAQLVWTPSFQAWDLRTPPGPASPQRCDLERAACPPMPRLLPLEREGNIRPSLAGSSSEGSIRQCSARDSARVGSPGESDQNLAEERTGAEPAGPSDTPQAVRALLPTTAAVTAAAGKPSRVPGVCQPSCRTLQVPACNTVAATLWDTDRLVPIVEMSRLRPDVQTARRLGEQPRSFGSRRPDLSGRSPPGASPAINPMPWGETARESLKEAKGLEVAARLILVQEKCTEGSILCSASRCETWIHIPVCHLTSIFF